MTSPEVAVRVPQEAYREVIASLSAEAKGYLCYKQDGRLFISKTHRFHPLVTGFVARLERLGLPCDKNHVDLSVITRLQSEQQEGTVRRSASDMQRLAKGIFDRAVDLRASDIHIGLSKTTKKATIRLRIHGDLEYFEEHPYDVGDQLCTAIYQTMADVSDNVFKPLSGQDARISSRDKLPPGVDGIRIATTPAVGGYAMVLRLLYNDTVESYDLGLLGYTGSQKVMVDRMRSMPYGINIICGPTGSGKSTTLQRIMLSILQATGGRKNVITVEDPPEYPIPGAVQTPVMNAETAEERSRQFQAAIKRALRLDPDILMIGEIRDLPSARLAVEAAMTGHQVWTTLHGNNALGVVDRLLDLGIPLHTVTDSSIVTGLMCQRLIQVLCEHCRVPLTEVTDRYSEASLRRVMSVVPAIEKVYVTGTGCEHCRNRGTSGRIAVAETILTDPTLMRFLKSHDKIEAQNYWLRQQGGMPILSHTIDKIEAGLVDPFAVEEVIGSLTHDNEGSTGGFDAAA